MHAQNSSGTGMARGSCAGCKLAALLAACLLVGLCSASKFQGGLQEQDTWKVLLPKGSQPEGIAAGDGNGIWVACLSGSIIHVNLATNTSDVVYKERNVHLSGIKFCKKQQLLFVAGTLSGKAYVYHVQRSAGPRGPLYTVVNREVLDLSLPGKSYINDLAISQDSVYFTDSFGPVLYQVPRFFSTAGAGPSSQQQRFSLSLVGGASSSSRPITRVKTGPHFDTKAGQFRANGIAVYKSSEHKDVLLVANTHTGHLYKVVVNKTADAAGSSVGTAAVAQLAQLSKATMAVASRLRLGLGSATSSNDSMQQPAAAAAAAADTEDPVGSKPPGSDSTAAVAAQRTKRHPAWRQKEAPTASADGPSTSQKPPAAAAAVAVAAAGAEAQPDGQGSKWSKLARDVQSELHNSKKRKSSQQKQAVVQTASATGDTAAAAAAAAAAVPASTMSVKDAAAVAVSAGKTVALLSKLWDVGSNMRRSKGQQDTSAPAASSRSSTAGNKAKSASAAAVARRWAGFTARPSADAMIKAGLKARGRHGSSSTEQEQEAGMLADPVKIPEHVSNINEAARAAAAGVAAAATTSALQARAFGRVLLGMASSERAPAVWPGQVARDLVDRLGLPGRHKGLTAEVTELQLPSIPGQYTQRLLVDGLVIRNDTAYVADNYNNRVWGLELGKGLSDVKVACVFQGPALHVPTTLLFQQGRLWWVNAHLDTCFPFLPCPAHSFELHGVNPSMCQARTQG